MSRYKITGNANPGYSGGYTDNLEVFQTIMQGALSPNSVNDKVFFFDSKVIKSDSNGFEIVYGLYDPALSEDDLDARVESKAKTIESYLFKSTTVKVEKIF